MPVLEAVQTFAGITNENEFYSHHYLAEVFKGDIKDRLEAWDVQEAQHPSDAPDHEQHRAPQKRLQAWAQRWFALRGQVQRGKDEHERWAQDCRRFGGARCCSWSGASLGCWASCASQASRRSLMSPLNTSAR